MPSRSGQAKNQASGQANVHRESGLVETQVQPPLSGRPQEVAELFEKSPLLVGHNQVPMVSHGIVAQHVTISGHTLQVWSGKISGPSRASGQVKVSGHALQAKRIRCRSSGQAIRAENLT